MFSIPMRFMFSLSAVTVAGFNPGCSGVSLCESIGCLERFSDLPMKACTAGLGELWVAGWPRGGCPNTTLPKSPSAQVTANAHRGIGFKCRLASLWDILLLISDVCLPIN